MLHTDEPTPCQEEVELWFSDEPEKIAEAKARCRTCLLRLRCLEETLETEAALGQRLVGVHGALDPTQRTKITMKRIA